MFVWFCAAKVRRWCELGVTYTLQYGYKNNNFQRRSNASACGKADKRLNFVRVCRCDNLEKVGKRHFDNLEKVEMKRMVRQKLLDMEEAPRPFSLPLHPHFHCVNLRFSCGFSTDL